MKKTISYDKLWKLLIDKKWNRTKLKEQSEISTASLAKLGKNANITTDVLVKICNALECDFSDIMEMVPVKDKGKDKEAGAAVLRINYRTTEEIRKAAFALLNGISFDDLDDSFDTGDRCQSLTHGTVPEVISAANANEEFDTILAKIKGLLENGVSAKNICVVARTHKLLDDYIAHFTSSEIRCYEIKGSRADDRGLEGIRVATMHRVKGLEFQYVFIVAANNRIIPLASAIDHTDAVSEQETMTAEKCLLYVALTRAQKGTFISGYGKMSELLFF